MIEAVIGSSCIGILEMLMCLHKNERIAYDEDNQANQACSPQI